MFEKLLTKFMISAEKCKRFVGSTDGLFEFCNFVLFKTFTCPFIDTSHPHIECSVNISIQMFVESISFHFITFDILWMV
jgi:hypothetical protein